MGLRLGESSMLHSNTLLCYNAGRLVNTVMEHVSILFCLLVYSHTKNWRCYRFKEGKFQIIAKEQEKNHGPDKCSQTVAA